MWRQPGRRQLLSSPYKLALPPDLEVGSGTGLRVQTRSVPHGLPFSQPTIGSCGLKDRSERPAASLSLLYGRRPLVRVQR